MKSYLLIVVSAFLFMQTAFSACSLGQLVCTAGNTGLGGCYSTGYICSDGLICQNTQTICLKGNTGLGGCVSSGYQCSQGLICQSSQYFCLKGVNGAGGCYSIGYKCNQGRICASSQSVCWMIIYNWSFKYIDTLFNFDLDLRILV